MSNINQTHFNVKGKVTRSRPEQAQRVERGIALSFRDLGITREWDFSITPRPLYHPGKTWYTLYRRLGGPQDRSRQV
jgi:hypothetical protein